MKIIRSYLLFIQGKPNYHTLLVFIGEEENVEKSLEATVEEYCHQEFLNVYGLENDQKWHEYKHRKIELFRFSNIYDQPNIWCTRIIAGEYLEVGKGDYVENFLTYHPVEGVVSLIYIKGEKKLVKEELMFQIDLWNKIKLDGEVFVRNGLNDFNSFVSKGSKLFVKFV